MTWAPNKSAHRMSGDKFNLKFEHPGAPLIGGLVRSAYDGAYKRLPQAVQLKKGRLFLMRIISAKWALTVFWIGSVWSIPGQALVSADDPRFGPNSLTVDTRTGLTWLDLPFSSDFSYLQAEAATQSGGRFAGFRHATVLEVLSLYNSAGFGEGLVAQADPRYPNAVALMSMLGETYPGAVVGISGTLNGTGQALAPFIAYSSFNNVDGIMFTTSRQQPGTYSALYDLDIHFPTVGNWLVEVPEPSVSALLLIPAALLTRKQARAVLKPR